MTGSWFIGGSVAILRGYITLTRVLQYIKVCVVLLSC